MTKGAKSKKSQTAKSTDTPKKPKAKAPKRTIGPAGDGERITIPLLTVKKGERVIIDTSGKGVVRINEIEFSNNSSITFTRPAKLTMQAGK